MSKRISIIAGQYRGKSGFKVVSGPGQVVFCESREQAECIKDVLALDLPFEQRVWAFQSILLKWA